jgi:hypothetical protein
MRRMMQWMLILLGSVLVTSPAMAWDPYDEPSSSESDDDWAVYIICIYGDRDDGSVPRKCAHMKRELQRMYPKSKVVRVNNPSKKKMEDLQRRVGKDIGVIIVVTHSTPDGSDDSWDVWDCPLQPEDIADIFDDKWVIWNGCYSADICREADNILPVQCESEALPEKDDTWRQFVRCLERTAGTSQDRDKVCKQVFGDDWDE